MSTTAFARTTARRLFAENDLTGWTFTLDRARTRFGQCRYRTKTISLSSVLLPARTDDETEQTLIHEVAHALTQGHHHDAVWLAKARSLGYRGGRCSDTSEDVRAVQVAQARWVGTCDLCGLTFPKFRRPRAGARYKHRGCRGVITFD